MSTSAKVNMAQQLLDRGVMSLNEARLLFNMEPLEEGGDAHYIRGEYKLTGQEVEDNADQS